MDSKNEDVNSDASESGENAHRSDPFRLHFEHGMTSDFLATMAADASRKRDFRCLGQTTVTAVKGVCSEFSDFSFDPSHLKCVLKRNWNAAVPTALECHGGVEDSMKMSGLQRDLLAIVSNYHDLYYPVREHGQAEELHFIIALHALNHALKTRGRILYHNAKLKGESPGAGSRTGLQLSPEYRDHGLCRSKVLILCPFRGSAFSIVQFMIKLLFGDDSRKLVIKRKRFTREFGDSEVPKKTRTEKDHAADQEDAQSHETERKAKRLKLCSDFFRIFTGNTDDCFHLGLAIAKKTLKLYVDYYKSDIIVASPLGLRLLMGSDQDKKSFDCDFLSSIEVLLLDQADVFLMQNWSHVLHVFEHLHRQPKETHDVDFSRIRMWCLNDQSKFYRQTVVFARVDAPELRGLFSKFCSNFAGLVTVPQHVMKGTVSEVVNHFPQTFLRVVCADRFTDSETRLRFFVDNVLTKLSAANLKHVLIFVPSYFDFIRVRNHLKREAWSFVHISEYTSPTKVSRGRSLFFHGKKPVLLLTERFHFFNRYLIRGVQHLVFYQLPLYADFYSELCNMVNDDPEAESKDHLCVILYSLYDALRLARTVGVDRANSLLKSEKVSHVLITTD